MNLFSRLSALTIAFAILFTSCTSTTMITSIPTKSKVFIDDAYVGETPYRHTDSKIVGSQLSIKLEKDGYQSFNTTITKDEDVNVGAIIGGLFVLVPFLWTMKYNPSHTFTLKPLTTIHDSIDSLPSQSQVKEIKSKVDRLRDLKALLDEKIITQQEFETEKAKILAEK